MSYLLRKDSGWYITRLTKTYPLSNLVLFKLFGYAKIKIFDIEITVLNLSQSKSDMKKVILFLSFFISSFFAIAQDAPELVCTAPYVGAYSTEATIGKVIWISTAATPPLNYTLQYRACSDSAWTTVNNITAGTTLRDTGIYTLGNLTACKCYVVRLRANCSATEVSDWRTAEFKTVGCVEPCRAPSSLFAATRDSAASLNWSNMGTGRTYKIQWKSRLDSTWREQTSSTNSLLINGLQPCTEYQFRVATVCSNTETSAYSESIKFKTSGCVAPCSTPREVVAVNVNGGILVKWVATGATAYEIMYSIGDSAARTVTSTSSFLTLGNVATCKTYKFKVRSICGTSTAPVYSEWSATISVNTEGCVRCNAPSRLSYTVTETGAVVKWDTTAGATYTLQILGPRDSTWRTVEGVRGNQYAFTGLTACSYYSFRVKTNCTTTSSSVWSSPIRFKTGGCAAVCLAPKNLKVYVADTVALVSWVTASSVNNFRLIVTNEAGTVIREANVTGTVYTLTGLERCKKYKIQLKTVCSSSSTSEIVTATIETRGCPEPCGTPREISFATDSNKVVVKWANMGAVKYYVEYKLLADSLAAWKRDSTTANTITLSNLQTCKTYMIRIASVCSTGISGYTNFTFTTTGCPRPCVASTALASEIVNDTAVFLKFSLTGAPTYTIQYRVAGTANWTSIQYNSINASALPVRVTGLLKCTTYQWRVLTNCSATSIIESASATFTTKGCPTPCASVPRDLVVSNYLADSAKLTWIMPATGLTYEVRYAAAADSSVFNATPVRVSTNAFVMRELVQCRYYIVQVRSICSNGQASDWVTKQFRFGANCFGDDEFAAQGTDMPQYISEFGVYPNPGSESVQVAYTLSKEANVKVELMNLQGQVVSRLDGGNQDMGSYIQTLDNLSNLNTGLYMVVIKANGKVVSTQKWQKQ
ncbi:MAG: fibronectin type III domain-containing protein [Saprospiraceae bacterium]|nr:fibronectin type III domain-containing protein [Saprospiraceae bacterium]